MWACASEFRKAHPASGICQRSSVISKATCKVCCYLYAGITQRNLPDGAGDAAQERPWSSTLWEHHRTQHPSPKEMNLKDCQPATSFEVLPQDRDVVHVHMDKVMALNLNSVNNSLFLYFDFPSESHRKCASRTFQKGYFYKRKLLVAMIWTIFCPNLQTGKGVLTPIMCQGPRVRMAVVCRWQRGNKEKKIERIQTPRQWKWLWGIVFGVLVGHFYETVCFPILTLYPPGGGGGGGQVYFLK